MGDGSFGDFTGSITPQSLATGLIVDPKWIKNNPSTALTTAALVAAPFTGGASLGAAGAAEAGAAGAGAAAADAGAATGAGLLGAGAGAEGAGMMYGGGTALGEGLGAGAADTGGLLGGLGGGAANEMGATSSSIGAAGAPANPLSIGYGNFMTQYGKPGLGMLKNANQGMQMGQQLMGGQPQQPHMQGGGQMPQMGGVPMSTGIPSRPSPLAGASLTGSQAMQMRMQGQDPIAALLAQLRGR